MTRIWQARLIHHNIAALTGTVNPPRRPRARGGVRPAAVVGPRPNAAGVVPPVQELTALQTQASGNVLTQWLTNMVRIGPVAHLWSVELPPGTFPFEDFEKALMGRGNTNKKF